MKTTHLFFMAEAEGVTDIVNTRQARLNAAVSDFIDLIKDGFDINDKDIQSSVLFYNDISDISCPEMNYIKTCVEKAV